MTDFDWEKAAGREHDRMVDELNDLREAKEMAEAELEEVCGENAELNDKIREAFDAKWKAEAELADLRERYAHVNAEYEKMMGQRKRLETEVDMLNEMIPQGSFCVDEDGSCLSLCAAKDRDRLREACLGLLHHMPLRGEPVTAKELAIKRARDVLARKGVSDGK